eukprot:CAMPEP_0181229310 /NCGR_PEP_ID=MMETSP1096-20121128/33825_1 /TAXON_ID=156174 ORGANISM="Chrysochromulina ericina, Strain CCMP281" /NCGR_SAMPLE_ID=MMETSP1096 /ASSEMBLY_ACC=CAM_ASM_000453 /LENGTH=110 /DNA_ID=CAMNT_0023322917 /DNA_START=1201 /DNA_END=1533 /DNA_ORIENTATION=-
MPPGLASAFAPVDSAALRRKPPKVNSRRGLPRSDSVASLPPACLEGCGADSPPPSPSPSLSPSSPPRRKRDCIAASVKQQPALTRPAIPPAHVAQCSDMRKTVLSATRML